MTLGLKFVFPSLSGASAYIVPTSYSTDDAGLVRLTPSASSIQELEAYAAMLHADIDRAVTEARKRFAKAAEAAPPPLFPN